MADINELNEAIILCGGKGTRLKEVGLGQAPRTSEGGPKQP